MPTPYISIVSPVYKGAEMVAELVARVSEACQTLTEDFEIILVDDASPDHAWNFQSPSSLRVCSTAKIKKTVSFML